MNKKYKPERDLKKNEENTEHYNYFLSAQS